MLWTAPPPSRECLVSEKAGTQRVYRIELKKPQGPTQGGVDPAPCRAPDREIKPCAKVRI